MPCPILENHIWSCHENHAFSHRPCQKNEDNFVSHSRGPMNNLTPIKNCPVVCKVIVQACLIHMRCIENESRITSWRQYDFFPQLASICVDIYYTSIQASER